MGLIADAYASRNRPALRGVLGAVSAAHPLAVAAGQELLLAGGSAADAAISGQAVLCVVAPDACGLGGDLFALVHRAGESAPSAVNASGAAPLGLVEASGDGPNSITVPGIVGGWATLSRDWGRLPLARCLEPAIRIARSGFRVPPRLAENAVRQGARLKAGGAAAWALTSARAGDVFRQDALAGLLEDIGKDGEAAFYRGAWAFAVARAAQALGGTLSVEDLAAHETVVSSPMLTRWRGVTVAAQPPMTQGVLLCMALGALDRLGEIAADRREHAAVELTESVFAYRSRAGEGAGLLDIDLPIDLERAGLRGGPRAYLHTAGVAVADAAGMTVSSLVSVFDDFGSCVFVPEAGIVLNNRAGGFTDGPNAAAPGKRPVHTLAPAMVLADDAVVALATPGADGQIQTLLQIITALFRDDLDLAAAIAKPRWRSEGGKLLIERSHPATAVLESLGHRLLALDDGDTRFGAVVCAAQVDGAPVAVSDWRRETWSGVV